MRQCSVVGCTAIGKWKVGAQLWAAGYSRETTAPLKLQTTVVVCDVHKEDPGSVGDFFPPDIRGTITQQVMDKGGAAPDFDGGEFWFVLLQ